ncbi:pseudouridine synthase [Sedimenticola sp.]|uniref:pseudouridine synthase n=1 Tax=Sedimenticola sp. TaxID=1940285 RepID=UPI003D0C409A
MQELAILYRDEHYIAVDKPAGLLVHRTRISEDRRFLLQQLRDQIGQRVYPVHRLDRPTSGLLVFALDSDAARRLVQRFEQRQVEKRYLAVVRGYAADAARIDYPLQEEAGKSLQQAVTDYRRLAAVELPLAVGRYATARYSLLEVQPQTGRMHQIRKHMKHIFHPIVGDTTHGDGKHNHLFREQFGIRRLLLMATNLRFVHPYSGVPLSIEAPPDEEMVGLFARLGWASKGLD